MSEEEGYVPIDNVAKHFSVSVSTIRAWIKDGKIPKDTFMQLGTTYRFKLSAVEGALVGGKAEVMDVPDHGPIAIPKTPINLY
jgi:excisionase family DNA binding protein